MSTSTSPTAAIVTSGDLAVNATSFGRRIRAANLLPCTQRTSRRPVHACRHGDDEAPDSTQGFRGMTKVPPATTGLEAWTWIRGASADRDAIDRLSNISACLHQHADTVGSIGELVAAWAADLREVETRCSAAREELQDLVRKDIAVDAHQLNVVFTYAIPGFSGSRVADRQAQGVPIGDGSIDRGRLITPIVCAGFDLERCHRGALPFERSPSACRLLRREHARRQFASLGSSLICRRASRRQRST